MAAPAPTSALAILRAATAADHRRLERRLTLLDPGLDAARYARYLGAFLDLTVAHESATAPFAALVPGFAARSKVAALRADLAALGVIEPIARPADWPAIADAPAALGAAYVLEGSTLGGAVLARELDARLPGAPTAFFRVYGPDLGARFRAFCDALEHRLPTEEHRTSAARAAAATFRAVERHLEVCHLTHD